MVEVTIDSWAMFTEAVEKSVRNYPDVTASWIQYRGQADYTWELESSLARIIKGNEKSESKARYYEKHAQMEFMSQCHLLDEKVTFDVNSHPEALLIDMQHFSCPTRLIDWSESPYIALYFAVSEKFETDGSLFFWNYTAYIANQKSRYPKLESMTFPQFMNQEDPLLLLIFATKKNVRIVKQRGTFSISNNLLKNHCEILREMATDANGYSGLTKYRIPAELKLEFLARLKTMNITPDSLFPGLDGLGRSIKEMLYMRKWSESKHK